jgi:hypothetical protein
VDVLAGVEQPEVEVIPPVVIVVGVAVLVFGFIAFALWLAEQEPRPPPSVEMPEATIVPIEEARRKNIHRVDP